MYDSPPKETTSTASSLLWEDMTLTSVSEDDAQHYSYLGYGSKGGLNRTIPRHQSSGSIELDIGDDNDDQLAEEEVEEGRGSKKRLFQSGGAHIERRPIDWDGYDNVVLSTTVYNTTHEKDGDGHRHSPTCGEVIVMELMSTKNPPLTTTSSKSVATAASRAEQCVKSIKNKPIPKISSSSSNSSRTSPASTSGVDQQHQSSSKTTTTSSEEDSTSKNTYMDEDDDDEGMPSNHTRIIARRVLYWPSYIESGGSSNDYSFGSRPKNKKKDECPSFVSLGRTNIWKERKSQDNVGSSTRADEGEDAEEESKGGDDDDRIGRRMNDNDNNHDPSSSFQRLNANDEERVADAMEVYRSLNFLFGGGSVDNDVNVTPVPKNVNNSDKQSSTVNKARKVDVAPRNYLNQRQQIQTKKKQKKLTQPLSMCLITQCGRVHFYYALRVFLSGSSSKSNKTENDIRSASDDISNSFATLFMGSELFTRVNDSVLPLSFPYANIQLSQVVSRRKVIVDEERNNTNDDPTIWNKFMMQKQEQEGSSVSSVELEDSTGMMDNDDHQNVPSSKGRNNNEWSNLGTFDASIDPSSLPLRTIRQSNVITGTCITSDTSNSYLATCGKGLRRRIVYDKENHNRRRIDYVLGGYVTFVSLRYCTSESRTIYLPFAPESIQPIYWMGMHFVVMLGEEGLPKEKKGSRQPYAMAVRVDSKQGGGEDDVTSPRLELDNDHYQHQKNVDPLKNLGSVFMSTRTPTVRNSSQLPNEDTLTPTQSDGNAVDPQINKVSGYPHRFQCVHIKLPSVHESLGLQLLSQLLVTTASGNLEQLDCVKSKAIAISSIPSSPPGILISFQVDSSTLIVVNHTLLPFQTEQERKKISLATHVRAGHRALLDVGSYCQNVWCTGGQVRKIHNVEAVSFV